MADENKLFQLQVISPDRVFFDGEADMIEAKTTEGEIGVYKHHIPMTFLIAPGILRIMKEGEVQEASLLDGFIEVLGDRITILAESCEWPDEIDIVRATEAKARAERRLRGEEGAVNAARAEFALRKALVRIELAQKYGK